MKRADAASRALIVKEATENGLDPDFVEAVFLQEGGTPGVYNWDVSHYAHGPMQTSLAAAYDGGYSPNDLVKDPSRGDNVFYSPALASSELSIKYGTRYLAQRGPIVNCPNGDYACYAAAYNAGNIIGVTPDGRYRNQSYVDSVWAKYKAIKGGSLPESPPSPDPSAMPSRVSFPCTLLNGIGNSNSTQADKSTPAYIPRSPYAPYISIRYTPKSGVTVELASARLDRPKYITYFEFHEKLGGLSTARARLFDTGGDVITQSLDISSSVRQDSVGNPEYDTSRVLRAATEQFNVLDNAKLVFGYAPSLGEEVEDVTTIGKILPGFFGEDKRKVDPLARFVSPRREMYLQNYQPRFLGYGVEVDLVFADSSAIASLESRTRTHTEEKDNTTGKKIASGQQGGIPEGDGLGIVETICNEHNWQVCSEPTKSLLSFDSIDGNTQKDRPISQTGKDDISFIREKLAPSAESSLSDGAAYSVFLDSSTQPSTLHFHTPNLSAPSSRSYYYTRARNGTVLRFEPVVNGQLVALFGGVTSVLAGTDMVNKKPISSTAKPGDSTNNSLPGAPIPEETTYQEDGPDGVPEVKKVAPSTVRNSSVKTQGEQAGAAQSFRESGSLAALSAQMVVLGDPSIRAGTNIDVAIEVFNPTGDSVGFEDLAKSLTGVIDRALGNIPSTPRELYTSRGLHYTSGKWTVMEVRHVIQGGQYLTYLDLMRNALQSPGFTGDSTDHDSTNTLSRSNVSNNLTTR